MSLLDIENITFSYGGDIIYHEASMRLFEGDHAVLVGPNGSGKTTLLKMLHHEFKPDHGSIKWIPNKRVGYLDQYAKLDGSLRVKTYLYEVFIDLFEKEALMEDLYEQVPSASLKRQEILLNRAAQLGEELIESEFYGIKSTVGDIMNGLGLSMDLLESRIKTLSGGMRAKIILGKLLLEQADVLLLDEPTNFLDVNHIDWLTKFLQNYPKAYIVISHHERFLKSIANTVYAIENKKITRYKGDFYYYLNERALRHEQHEKAYVSQQKFIKNTEEFIQKNLTRASTTKRAQSRRKMLHKVKRYAAPKSARTYQFKFPIGRQTGRDVLKIKALEIGYTSSLIEPLTQVIMKEEKVVITGKNGIGKSTFLKTILDKIPPIDGSYEWIDSAQIAYFEQESSLDEQLTPFQIVHNRYPHFTKKDVMTLLAGHGIDYDMARRLIGTLSGGEQTKTRLALLRHQKGNVLIIDEPTNHLDDAAKEALKKALIAYQGTLILVSHESDFYEAICDYEIAFMGE